MRDSASAMFAGANTVLISPIGIGRRMPLLPLFAMASIGLSQGHWTGAFASALFAENDQPIAIELLQMQTPKSSLKKSKTRIFGTPNPLSYLLEVIAMKADKISEFP